MAALIVVHIVSCLLFLGGINAAQVSNDGLRYLVIGDWGGLPDFPYRTAIEAAVGRQMAAVVKKYDMQFVLALGDNFYFDGVKDEYDARFKDTYEKVYNESSLNLPWYFVAGNHDHNGNVSAQIAYSKHDKRWNFPDYYYTLSYKIPGSALTMDIVMIDTVILCGNSDHDFKLKQPTGPKCPDAAKKHFMWIEKQLMTSKADYLLVAGHYPVWSVAGHGPTPCLLQQLKPMLEKYQATAYFCGHDHNLQHLRTFNATTNQTLDYLVSGAANFVEPLWDHMDAVPKDSLKFHWADIDSFGGLGYVEANHQQMTFTFVQANGKMLYKTVLYPRKM